MAAYCTRAIIFVSMASVCLCTGLGGKPTIGVLQARNISNLPYNRQVYTIMSVSFVKQAGGAAVPIFVDQTDEYYEQLIPRLNAVYLPGGSSGNLDSPYAETAIRIYRMAKDMNDRGIYFPIWGVCLGLQNMATWAFQPRIDPVSICSGVNPKMMTLNFTEDARKSRLFGEMPHEIYDALANDEIASNFHSYGLAMDFYNSAPGLKEMFMVTSTNHDDAGMEFVSSMEARDYPFYGLQWHPEKVSFMDTLVAARELEQPGSAFIMSRWMSDYLRGEANKNDNSFLSRAEQERFHFNRYETREKFAESISQLSFDNFSLPQFDGKISIDDIIARGTSGHVSELNHEHVVECHQTCQKNSEPMCPPATMEYQYIPYLW